MSDQTALTIQPKAEAVAPRQHHAAGAAMTFDEMWRLAKAFAMSGLFGIKTAEQAMALMAISQAEGIHPALAARDYHIIQGRPALKADTVLARFQAAGGKVQWLDYDDRKVSATFSHPQGGEVAVEWTIERAQRIGLATKDNWKHYPRNMMRARVISEGVRAVYPGAIAGMYTPEEAMDMPASDDAGSDVVYRQAAVNGHTREEVDRAVAENAIESVSAPKQLAGFDGDEPAAARPPRPEPAAQRRAAKVADPGPGEPF